MTDEIKPGNDTPAATAEAKKDVLITPDGEELDLSIVGTMKIKPRRFTPRFNSNRFHSVKFAVAGLLYMFAHEQSIRWATFTTVIVIIIGLWLEVSLYNWAFLALALGSIWVTECLNTAIEATIDLKTSEPHPMAKVGKDVASAATLVSSIVFLIIVLLILVPRIIDRLNGS